MKKKNKKKKSKKNNKNNNKNNYKKNNNLIKILRKRKQMEILFVSFFQKFIIINYY